MPHSFVCSVCVVGFVVVVLLLNFSFCLFAIFFYFSCILVVAF